MRIEGVDVPSMRRAVQVYLEHAWAERPEARPGSPIDFEGCSTPEDVLRFFRRDDRAGNMRRYALKLGNARYPFMKLIFQELLVRDRFFFAVDTHDDLDLKDSIPDYEQWLDLKRYNRRLKEMIEHGWQESHVPTFADIVAQVERETPPGPALRDSSPRILVVDDDLDIAQGVCAILDRHGYRTRQAHSAEEALEMLEAEIPDLILSDLEMGGMSGLELASRLREHESTARVPFILATAASIGSTNFRVIDGFLVKPYDGELLLKFISRHVASRDGGEAAAAAEADKGRP
jgi:CheY-like chemotaxis protein